VEKEEQSKVGKEKGKDVRKCKTERKAQKLWTAKAAIRVQNC
jgi:hypothetical protein